MRMLIQGGPGSGKSALAIKIANITGTPVFHLDDIFWLPNWKENPLKNFRKEVEILVKNDKWIIDGNYNKIIDLTLPRATVVVFLDLTLYNSLLRLFFRGFGRNSPIKIGEITPLPKNVQDKGSIKRIFESIFVLWYYAINFRLRKKSNMIERLTEYKSDKTILFFKRKEHVESFVSSFLKKYS